MGYRSTVVIALNKSAFTRFIALVNNNTELKDLLSYADETVKAENGDVLITWTDIKWYDNYPDVVAVNEFVDEICANSEDCLDDPQVTFLRLGEETGDIYHRSSGYDYVRDLMPTTSYNVSNHDMVPFKIFETESKE